MTDGLQGMSDRDILIQVWTRQQDMSEDINRISVKINSLGDKVAAHDRAISRIQAIGGFLVLVYTGVVAIVGGVFKWK